MLTTDPNNPDINVPGPNGQDKVYLVLSKEERAKGFVRPVRNKYTHKGMRPKHQLIMLSEVDRIAYEKEGYVAYEKYPPEELPIDGRYWTQEQLNSGCGQTTVMENGIAETYAREPRYYGSTFCVTCGKHFLVSEFVWDDGSVVGS